MTPLLWAYIGISALAAPLTVYDKVIAGSGRRRVPEQTLWLAALLGGSAAMYLTMLLIRHKTRHRRFMLGLPLLLLTQAVVWYIVH